MIVRPSGHLSRGGRPKVERRERGESSVLITRVAISRTTKNGPGGLIFEFWRGSRACGPFGSTRKFDTLLKPNPLRRACLESDHRYVVHRICSILQITAPSQFSTQARGSSDTYPSAPLQPSSSQHKAPSFNLDRNPSRDLATTVAHSYLDRTDAAITWFPSTTTSRACEGKWYQSGVHARH